MNSIHEKGIYKELVANVRFKLSNPLASPMPVINFARHSDFDDSHVIEEHSHSNENNHNYSHHSDLLVSNSFDHADFNDHNDVVVTAKLGKDRDLSLSMVKFNSLNLKQQISVLTSKDTICISDLYDGFDQHQNFSEHQDYSDL
jgi:hypothetical protein